MSSELNQALRSMRDRWSSGKGELPGPPAGVYRMQLQNAEMQVSSSGNPMVRREHLILDGQFTGEVVFDFISLSNELGDYNLSRWIEMMGYERPTDPEELPETIEAIATDTPTVQGRVRVARGFRNVDVQRLLDTSGVVPEEEYADEEEVEVEEEEAPEDGEEEEEEDKDTSVLVEFCEACDIDGVTSETSEEDIVQILQEYEWNADELTPEEQELLEGYGIEVVKPKPKTKTKAKK